MIEIYMVPGKSPGKFESLFLTPGTRAKISIYFDPSERFATVNRWVIEVDLYIKKNVTV